MDRYILLQGTKQKHRKPNNLVKTSPHDTDGQTLGWGHIVKQMEKRTLTSNDTIAVKIRGGTEIKCCDWNKLASNMCLFGRIEGGNV